MGVNQWENHGCCRQVYAEEAECIQRLVKLDRLRLIALLPGNRIRLNVARDFDWRPQGRFATIFNRGLSDFLEERLYSSRRSAVVLACDVDRTGADKDASRDPQAAPEICRAA